MNSLTMVGVSIQPAPVRDRVVGLSDLIILFTDEKFAYLIQSMTIDA